MSIYKWWKKIPLSAEKFLATPRDPSHAPAVPSTAETTAA